MLKTAIQKTSRLKTQALLPSMMVLNALGALSRMPFRYP